MKKDKVMISRDKFTYDDLGRVVKHTQRKEVSIYYDTRKQRKDEIERKTKLYQRGEL